MVLRTFVVIQHIMIIFASSRSVFKRLDCIICFFSERESEREWERERERGKKRENDSETEKGGGRERTCVLFVQSKHAETLASYLNIRRISASKPAASYVHTFML